MSDCRSHSIFQTHCIGFRFIEKRSGCQSQLYLSFPCISVYSDPTTDPTLRPESIKLRGNLLTLLAHTILRVSLDHEQLRVKTYKNEVDMTWKLVLATDTYRQRNKPSHKDNHASMLARTDSSNPTALFFVGILLFPHLQLQLRSQRINQPNLNQKR